MSRPRFKPTSHLKSAILIGLIHPGFSLPLYTELWMVVRNDDGLELFRRPGILNRTNVKRRKPQDIMETPLWRYIAEFDEYYSGDGYVGGTQVEIHVNKTTMFPFWVQDYRPINKKMTERVVGTGITLQMESRTILKSCKIFLPIF